MAYGVLLLLFKGAHPLPHEVLLKVGKGNTMTKLTLSGLTLLSAASLACANALSDATEAFQRPKTASGVQVRATHMSAKRNPDRVVLKDNVNVIFGGYKMIADLATYNKETGDIEASGHVKLSATESNTWTGESIKINTQTGAAVFSSGALRANNFTLLSDGLVRDEKGVFSTGDATVSTCTNPEHHWHWSLKGEIEYKDGEWFKVSNVVPRFMGVPVMWMPYYYRDMNTHYGFRVKPGYSSDWGAYLLVGYRYPIFGSSEEGARLSGMSTVDFRSKRGIGVGQEFRWLNDTFNQRGGVSFYYINDREEEDQKDLNWSSGYDADRYSIKMEHYAELSPRDTFRFRSEYLSDSMFREDFDKGNLRSFSQPISFVSLEHTENVWTAGVIASAPLNDFYAGTKRLPELWLNAMPQELFDGSRLYYESTSTIGWMGRQPAYYENAEDRYQYQLGKWMDYDAMRFDTRHYLRRPITLVDGITLTPRAGVRSTAYSNSAEDGAIWRNYGELGARLQANFYADYDQIKHTVQPYVDWSYVPGVSGMDADDGYAFDQVDRSYEWRDDFARNGYAPPNVYNGLRLGVRNLFQERTEEGLSHFFDIDMYGILVMDNDEVVYDYVGRDKVPLTREDKSTGLRVLGFDASYTPTQDFKLKTTLEFDPEEGNVSLFDINLSYDFDAITLYGGVLARDHEIYDYMWNDQVDATVIYGGFEHVLSDIWAWSLYARFDAEQGDLEEIGGYLDYSLDCMTFRFSLDYMSAYTSDDDYDHQDDVSFSVGLWLKAFPRKEEADWMSWGNAD